MLMRCCAAFHSAMNDGWPFDVEPFHKAVALEIIDLAALLLQTKVARSSMDEPL